MPDGQKRPCTGLPGEAIDIGDAREIDAFAIAPEAMGEQAVPGFGLAKKAGSRHTPRTVVPVPAMRIVVIVGKAGGAFVQKNITARKDRVPARKARLD